MKLVIRRLCITRLFTVTGPVFASAFARAQTEVWSYTLPNANTAVGGIVADAGGNPIVAGHTDNPQGQPIQRYVTKFSFDGQPAWTRTFAPGDPFNSSFLPHVDENGDVFLVEILPQSTTLWIQKLSGFDGSVLWTATQTHAATSVMLGRLVVSDNGDVTCLLHYAMPSAGNRTVVMRFDAAGNLVWDTFAIAPNTPQFSWMELGVHPQYGAWYQTYLSFGNVRLVHVDNQGQIVWSASYSDPLGINTGGIGVTIDAAGTAHWYVPLQWNSQTHLPVVEVQVDINGNVIGANHLGVDQFSGYDHVGHRFVLSGQSLTSSDVLVEVRDDAGQLLWSQSIPPPPGYVSNHPEPRLDRNGGVVEGTSWMITIPPFSTTGDVRRYDSSGHFEWLDASGGPGNFVGVPFAPDASLVGYSIVPAGQPLTLRKMDATSSGFCFGDGISSTCPCGNSSAPSQQAGCAHSLGIGASLAGSGNPSLASDGLSFAVQGATGSALLIAQGSTFQANGAGTSFGDGLRCIGGTIVRIATRPLSGGAVQYPQVGDPSISVRGGITSPGTRTYQGFFRNNAAFCTPSTQNTTNGVFVHWLP